MQSDILQSTATTILLKVYLSSDHVTPATGKTVAVTISKNTAAFANPSAGATNATEIANGWYWVTLSATDTGTLGPLIVLGTCTGCDNADQAFTVKPATNMGMTALPATPVTTNASLLTSGAGTDQLSVSAGKVLLQATQTGVTIPTVTTVTNQLTAAQVATGVWQDKTPADFAVSGSAGKYLRAASPGADAAIYPTSGSVNIVAATSTTATLDAGASAVAQAYQWDVISILTGTGAGQSRIVTNYTTGRVATITPAWTTIPDTTSTYDITPTASCQVVNYAPGQDPGSLVLITPANKLFTDATGRVDVGRILGTASAGAAGYVGIDWSHINAPTTTVNLSGTTISGVTGLTPASVATAVWTDTTASDFATLTSPGKIIFAQLGGAFTTTSSSVYTVATLANAPTGTGGGATAAQIATAVWQDTTSGDFTVAGSIGKSLFTSGVVPGAAGGISTYAGGPVASVTGSVGSIAGVTFPTNFGVLGISAAGKLNEVVLVDTLTTYTGNTPQTGDSFARIGATGSGLTSLAPASTALSTAQWTNTRAALQDNLDVAVSTRSTYAGGAVASVAAPVTVSLAQTLATARSLNAISDTALTLNDALHCAVATYAGQWAITGTNWVCKTPSTGTVLRSFTLDSPTTPTSRT